MGKNIISKEQAEEIVKNCYSIADFCRSVGWITKGNNYKIFHKYVKEYNLDISHFTFGKKQFKNFNLLGKKYSLNEYLKSNHIRGKVLIKKMVEEGVKERKCESCGLTKWKGEEIPLELHHIDGNHFNNDLDNLQLLCPNCHSFTDNFRGKRNKKNKTEHKCIECGKEISRWSNSGLCSDCTKKKQRKVERPSLEELERLLSNNSYVAVGKMFNVSDNTIRKWIKNYKKSS